MKVIISQEHIDKLKRLIKKHGIYSLGIEPYRFIEMGLVEHYNEYLDLNGTPIKSLGNLKSVDGGVDLRVTSIETLSGLTSVENDLYLTNTPIKDLGKLKYVGGDLYLNSCKNLTDLGELNFVGGYLYLRNTPISMSKYDIKKKIKVGGEIVDARW